ncbi:MAG: prolyl oligopeptidase family serine peptidase [Planctomycetes bacterium]|nr:prolyl oligopeptidase family serine peptidase [Planctomycetota bacterium]
MRAIFVVSILAFCAMPAAAQEAQKPKDILPKEALVIKLPGQAARSAVHIDPIEAQIVAGTWKAPKAGDELRIDADKVATWEKAEFKKENTLVHPALRGGYAYVPIEVEKDGVWMLEAAGNNMVYVNGEPRAGDPYSHGYLSLPVYLRKGTNDLLFLVGRGQLRVKLTQPKKKLFISNENSLLPDFLSLSDELHDWMDGSVVIVNASTDPASGVSTWTNTGADNGGVIDPISWKYPPLSITRVPFRIHVPLAIGESNHPIKVRLMTRGPESVTDIDSWEGKIHVRKRTELYRRTFISDIDGSVQYYAVQPASKVKDGEATALFLTLHGAAVEASGQAAAYPRKEWGHLVAPTNRRPYGFDWEDWGRLDALEVLEHARKELKTDPKRTYLTGHSMGGHGTWHLGVTYPEKWAAIGPSAGWMSFWTYGTPARKKPDSPVQEMFHRANNGSDTSLLANNLANLGVYVLHGDADNNVPVKQARKMKEILEGFHKDFGYHEEPKAGHWWGGAKEGGCVDWKPMFELFQKRTIPVSGDVHKIDFITANPGVSSRYHWLEILAQKQPLELSRAKVDFDPEKRIFSGTTENVSRLALDLAHLNAEDKIDLVIDGQKLNGLSPTEGKLWLERQDNKWQAAKRPALGEKGPHRYGPFRDAFRHRMVFVVGTKGTPEETKWAWSKARFDAETWYYRANGSVDVVADSDFNPAKEKDRGIILYGNADTHGLWKELLGESPVQVQRGKVTIGMRTLDGDDLACLFLRPRPESDKACVAVIGGTGLKGMRLTDRMPIFLSGVAHPDCFVAGPETLTNGFDGIRAAGYFGIDWSVESGGFAWGK